MWKRVTTSRRFVRRTVYSVVSARQDTFDNRTPLAVHAFQAKIARNARQRRSAAKTKSISRAARPVQRRATISPIHFRSHRRPASSYAKSDVSARQDTIVRVETSAWSQRNAATARTNGTTRVARHVPKRAAALLAFVQNNAFAAASAHHRTTFERTTVPAVPASHGRSARRSLTSAHSLIIIYCDVYWMRIKSCSPRTIDSSATRWSVPLITSGACRSTANIEQTH